MATQIRTSTYTAAPVRTLQWRNGLIAFNSFCQCVTNWRRRISERNELRKLSDRDLADFMCSKADASAETSKWFWEA